jgi:predicted NACHT family NTPase
MAKRSLYASISGIRKAKTAFSRKGWTQENLAFEVNLKTRQPIWRFFTGRPIERYIFVEICSILELNWREIAENPPDEIPEYDEHALPDIDCLVQQVRSQRQDKIEDQCGTLKLLDINRPVNLDKIYIEVNLLEEIPSQQWLELAELQNLTPQEFHSVGLDELFEQWIAGIQLVENYSKIRILGNPGTGKTTFLQHLALQCNRGLFMANRVPIFITLKSFVEESKEIGEVSFLNYIHSEFFASSITNQSTIENLFCEGRVLLLLDGLDEVLNIDTNAVYQEIDRFTEKYYKNLFIITCRTAGKIHNLNGFIDVEIAPFTSEQITEFSQKWFATLIKNPTEDTHQQAVQFIQLLDLPENLRFRQLAATPLFLHLACWIFVHQGQFPGSETEFYKQCLDLLLGKWDEIRGVQRDIISPELALPQKLKLLSEIAMKTFDRGEYFFEKRTIEQYISDYLCQLPDTPIDAEELQLASEDILKAIALQHGLLTERSRGIFSFSHLAFHEYFTSRNIIMTSYLESLEEALEELIHHVLEPRWREIFLLTAVMLRKADILVLLMKKRIDDLIMCDRYLQEFLILSNQSPAALSSQSSDWDFTAEQQEVLENYHEVNQLLRDCLNSNSEITSTVREEIENELLHVPQLNNLLQ